MRRRRRRISQTQIRQPRMVIGATPQRPAVLSIRLCDGRSFMHANRCCIRPSASNSQFRCHRNETSCHCRHATHKQNARQSRFRAGPHFLDQAIVQLPDPFSRQKRNDLGAAIDELGSVPPAAVRGIGQRHAFGVAAVRTVLGKADLLDRGFVGERRHGYGMPISALTMSGNSSGERRSAFAARWRGCRKSRAGRNYAGELACSTRASICPR